ncbi:hypothetical protein, partial [Candidatus Hakubella thermalkaliphila]
MEKKSAPFEAGCRFIYKRIAHAPRRPTWHENYVIFKGGVTEQAMEYAGTKGSLCVDEEDLNN